MRDVVDIVDVLREDHARIRRLLRQLHFAHHPDRRAHLVARLDEELRRHTQAEERHFYPAYRSGVASEEAHVRYHERRDEHGLVVEVLADCRRLDPASPEHIAKGRLLQELLDLHLAEEEKGMFRQARHALGRDDLRRLGERVLREREAAVYAA